MAIDVNILVTGPDGNEDGAQTITTQAINYIPGETVEQLISRALYHIVRHSYPLPGDNPRLVRCLGAHEQVIELRLVREI